MEIPALRRPAPLVSRPLVASDKVDPAPLSEPMDRLVSLTPPPGPPPQISSPFDSPATIPAGATGDRPGAALALPSGVAAGVAGTLLMTAEPSRPSGLGPPQRFTLKDVQGYYLTGDEEALSPAGLQLYRKVRAHYLDPIPTCPVGTPTVYFTGGLPGSGKGTIVERMWKESPDFVWVDPDQIKRDIVEDLAVQNPALRRQMEQDPEWGTAVHWTSSLLAKELMQDALKTGKEIVFDSSMSTPDQDKYRRLTAAARHNGYRIHGIISDVGIEKSVERAKKRAQKPIRVPLPSPPGAQETLTLPGRMVTADYIRGCQGRLQTNLEAYLTEGLFDQLDIFNNDRDGQAPRLDKTYHRVDLGSGRYTGVAGPAPP